ALIFSTSPWYADVYGSDSLSDQRSAGGIMMSVDVAIIVAALIFFFARAAADHDAAERRAAAAT
nr:cytochrome c oxidase assembly protein [Actinomycetota bacterium]